MSAATPKASVIMRSKNSEGTIAQALSGLFSQDFTDFELLVVDSGSTDQTCAIVRQYPCQLVQIEPKAYFPGAVLNMAIEQTCADLVVFLNSDAVPLSPHALERLLAPFEDPEVQATFARQLPRPDAETWVRCDYARSFPATPTPPPWIRLSLPLAALRKTAWQAHPFYTDAWASEDTEWGHWARAHGRKIQYVPDALVMHSHNYTLRQIYGRRFVEGEADAFIYGGRDTLSGMFMNMAIHIARDGLQYVQARDLMGILFIPARRIVDHWAYHQGRRLGERRKATGNTDASIGQKTVLARRDD